MLFLKVMLDPNRKSFDRILIPFTRPIATGDVEKHNAVAGRRKSKNAV